MTEETDVIETNIMFATEVKVDAKVRKVTTYGSQQPEYKLVEIAGISIDSDILDDEDNKKIVKVLREIVLDKVKIYEKDLKEYTLKK